ncbi:arylsulfatase B-like [Ixodes scapularis]
MKASMRKAIERKLLSSDIMLTLTTEVEGAMNYHPLTYVHNETEGPVAITTADKIRGKQRLPSSGASWGGGIEDAWRSKQQFSGDRWSQWHEEYLKPFFCYFSHQAVHSALMKDPFQAPERNLLKFPYIGETNRTVYAGMLDALDESIGRVVEVLRNAGMLGDTIIAFSSDNGGSPFGLFSNRGFNWPLRGAKANLWEGGVRVPAFVWSSKFLKKPRVSDQLMHISDWLPTLYSAAGGDVSNLGSMDGIDMWRYLTLGFGSPRKEVLLTIDPKNNLAALRYKNYKLVVGEGFNEELDGRYSFPGGLRPTNDVPQLRKDSKVVTLAEYAIKSLLLLLAKGYPRLEHCTGRPLATRPRPGPFTQPSLGPAGWLPNLVRPQASPTRARPCERRLGSGRLKTPRAQTSPVRV